MQSRVKVYAAYKRSANFNSISNKLSVVPDARHRNAFSVFRNSFLHSIIISCIPRITSSWFYYVVHMRMENAPQSRRSISLVRNIVRSRRRKQQTLSVVPFSTSIVKSNSKRCISLSLWASCVCVVRYRYWEPVSNCAPRAKAQNYSNSNIGNGKSIGKFKTQKRIWKNKHFQIGWQLSISYRFSSIATTICQMTSMSVSNSNCLLYQKPV